jgi:hypothetical protein
MPELESFERSDESQPASAGHVLQLMLAVEAASVDGGDYQGLSLSTSWHYQWASAALTLPVYRLRLGDNDVLGLGDVTLQAHARFVQTSHVEAGLTAAVGLPTGEYRDGLGMGHVMAMAGGFARAELQPVSLLASVLLAKSLGATAGLGAHVEHALGRVVNPMSSFELGSMLRASIALGRGVSAYAVALLALPIVDSGVTRLEVGPGARLALGALWLNAEIQFGLAGDPFGVRTVVAAGYQFGGRSDAP